MIAYILYAVVFMSTTYSAPMLFGMVYSVLLGDLLPYTSYEKENKKYILLDKDGLAFRNFYPIGYLSKYVAFACLMVSLATLLLIFKK